MDMFSKQKFTSVVIVLLIVLNLATISTLWLKDKNPPPPPGENQPNRGVEQLLSKELKLTEKQKTEFTKLRESHFKATRSITKEIHELKKEMMDQLNEVEFDPIAVEMLANEIGEKQAKIEEEIFNHFVDLLSVCNDDQKKKFRTLLSNFFPNPENKPPRPGGTPPPHMPPGPRGEKPPRP